MALTCCDAIREAGWALRPWGFDSVIPLRRERYAALPVDEMTGMCRASHAATLMLGRGSNNEKPCTLTFTDRWSLNGRGAEAFLEAT